MHNRVQSRLNSPLSIVYLNKHIRINVHTHFVNILLAQLNKLLIMCEVYIPDPSSFVKGLRWHPDYDDCI